MVNREIYNSKIKIVAIILAGGFGKRVGFVSKWKLVFDGKNLFDLIYDKLVSVGIYDICCVLNSDSISEVIHKNDVRYIVNNNPEMGMISSIHCGIKNGVIGNYYMLFPIDYPFVNNSTILSLMNYTFDNNFDVLKPVWCGETGHPIIISKSVADLVPCNYEGGLKSFIDNYKFNISYLRSTDDGILININTLDDMKKYSVKFN